MPERRTADVRFAAGFNRFPVLPPTGIPDSKRPQFPQNEGKVPCLTHLELVLADLVNGVAVSSREYASTAPDEGSLVARSFGPFSGHRVKDRKRALLLHFSFHIELDSEIIRESADKPPKAGREVRARARAPTVGPRQVPRPNSVLPQRGEISSRLHNLIAGKRTRDSERGII